MEVDLSSPVVLDASIRNIKFGLATAEEIRTYSINDSPISHPSQLTNPFLGLPLESGKCESCGTAEHGECEGHFGYIPLITPVYHPCHISELRNILSLVCLKCMRMKKGKLKNSLGREKVSSTSCFYCRELPAISIMEVKTTDGAFCLELKVSSRTRYKNNLWNFMDKFGFHYGDTFCRPLLPYEALRILIEIPEETKRKLAGKGFFPQDGFILQYLPVPPNCLYVPEISDGKSIMSSDISVSLLKKVLSKNELIKRSRSGFPNFESHEIESNDLQSSITQYLHLRGTTKAPLDIQNKLLNGNDVAQLSGKRWLEKMKTLFISKGSGFCSRSVICGDAYIGVNVIGLPIEIAKKITFEERVTKYNINRLQEIVDNRLCITYRDGLSTYAIAVGSKGHTYLKVGQIINRRIMDGDIVFINRPPSTHKHSLQAFSVFIHEDHTVKINPLVCAPFGADFDGDCIHIFYPQSLAAKAEVRELFSVEKQLLSSHSGNLNLPLVHDSLLSLKLLFNRTFLSKATAQQLAMFVSPVLPPPAVLKAHDGGPFWTVVQILQSALPASFDSVGVRHLIRNSEILKLDPNKDMLQAVFIDIATSIVVDKSPQEALRFLDQLQPLLMETLFLEGYSLDLRDFEVPKDMIENLWKNAQEISGVLDQLRWAYNDLVDKQVEDHIKNIKLPIVSFIIKSPALGGLVDSKSDSAIQKVVEQIGLLGIQISDRGKLYSKALVEDLFIHYVSKYSSDKVDNPSEAYGLIKNSFFHGLNPFEEMIHSIASREVIVRSSRGLTEPGTLFKNLMAILRDVSICYDGTVRNVCSNSIVQFEYGVSSAGEPVGVLAATAISNPAYKAVLDSSRSTNSSWELMKEILLCKVNFKNDAIDRRVILYLKDCHCGKKFCKENAAFLVQNCLRRVTLKECAVDFSIEYQKQIVLPGNSEAVSGLVGHIHLDQMRLNILNQSIDVILHKCQDVIFSYGKKKGQLAYFYRKITLSTCECCSFQQPNHGASSQFPCLQFSICDASPDIIPLERTIHVMADAIFPILLDTIVKGDPRVHAANIVWVGPDTYAWVRNSSASLKGELAIEVDIEKDVVRRNGDAWRIVLDACLPVMHLIDSRRSIPYGIQQIQEFLGISCAFDQSVQRLSTSVKMVAKGVLKEHLILVANNMTCTGRLIGFSTGGYKALFRSLKVQVPFTEATLYTPMKCFERAAEKLHTDSLASIVSSCSWGKHVAIGTGTPFQLIWDKDQMANNQDCGEDVYDFLELVRVTPREMEATGVCLGADVDNLFEEDEGNEPYFSPEPIFNSEEPIFDDAAELEPKWGANGKIDNGELCKSSWENGIGATSKFDVSDKADAWGSWKPKNADSESSWTKKSNMPNCWSENVMKVKPDGSEKLQIRDRNASLNLKSQPSHDSPSKLDTWGNQQSDKVHDLTSSEGVSHSKYRMGEWGKDSIQDGWGLAKETAAEHGWDHHLTRKTENVEGLEEASPSDSKMNIWEGEGSEKASSPTSLNNHIWKENKANNDKKHSWNSRGWGSSQVADHKMQKNHPTRSLASLDDRKSWNANRTFTSTGRRSDFFTSEEEKILVDVEPIMQTIRKILHESSDGDRISSDDQKFVIENVFKHHPDKQAKVTDEIDYIMVDKHKNFQESRCFYVVSTDGSSADFSYIKCMESYVKEAFPEHAETFNRKYFRRRRSEPMSNNGQQQQQ